MATIPLQLAQRRLDTGTPVQYPQGSPLGAAMQGFGDELSAVAERYRRMREQQEAFDAELARRRFNSQIAQAEDEVAANAPADGSGLHEAMYGQVDPRTGQAVKPGLFDRLFGDALPNMPESQRANFARQKEAMRRVGGLRMARRQFQRRQDYEQAQVDTVLQTNAIAIGKANPDDIVTFEAARQDGLDLIDKMGLDPGIRQQKVKDWFSTAAKARFEALIAKDPQRALEMFGVGTPVEPSGGDAASGTTQAAGSFVSGSSKAATGKGDRVGKQTPDERVAQAFRDDLPQQEQAALIRQAEAAKTAQQVELRTSIGLAEQNAPDAIRDTGTYSGPTLTPEQFIALYGATEGVRRFKAFNQAINVSRQFYGMRGMSNDAVRAMIGDAAPKEDSANPDEDRAHHDAIAVAADLTFRARQGDPGGYVRKTFASLDAAWNNLSKPEDYQAAIIGSIAAQQQLGFETVKPLPNSVAGDVVDGLKNVAQQQDQEQTLSSIFAALPIRAAREAMLGHLLQTSAAQTEKSIADRTRREAIVDPKMLLDVRKAVELGLSDANAEVTNYIPTLQDKVGGFIAGDSKPGSVRHNLTGKLVGSAGAGEQGFSLSTSRPLALCSRLIRLKPPSAMATTSTRRSTLQEQSLLNDWPLPA